MSIKEYELEEFEKRDRELCLIASENYPSQEVLNASGSIFQLKYAEGFPNQRYYQGCEIVDLMEQDCIDTCLELFNAKDEYLANVQPNSGASANMIVYNAILNAGDTVLAMDVKAGGHISHSHPKSFIAKYHNVIPYGVNEYGLLDYEYIEELAEKHKPKLIIAGASNYSREIDFKKFKEIADKVGAYLMADIAHISILVAHGLHQSPVGLADFITFTTHKCLKGARGGVVIYKKEFDKSIKLSTIPSLFGGSLEHQIYAKLVCFKEALTDEARDYSARIIKNSKEMERWFHINNIPIVTGGTDNHLMTINLTNFNISGKQLAEQLEECGVICNCNTVPNDKRSFLETSGIRLGTPAITARGLDLTDVYFLTDGIAKLINCYRDDYYDKNIEETKQYLSKIVKNIVDKYPLSMIYYRYAKTQSVEAV